MQEELTRQEHQCLQDLWKLINECQDELVIGQKHKFVDEDLIIGIRIQKFDVEDTFEKLKHGIYLRYVKYPDLCKKYMFFPLELRYVYDNPGGGVLKHRDSKGRHAAFLRAKCWDPDEISLKHLIAAAGYVASECVHFKETQLNGGVIIIDLKEMNLKQVKHSLMRYKEAMAFRHLAQMYGSTKLKGVHLLNPPKVFSTFISMVLRLAPEKISKRIHNHGSSLESLHKWFSPQILPDWLGGTLSQEEAVDSSIISNLLTPEKDKYYRFRIEN